VLIDGVTVLSGKANGSRISGFDETHTIEDVTLKNITILGERITDLAQGKFEVDEATTKNIKVE
jgi:hypothetical protein